MMIDVRVIREPEHGGITTFQAPTMREVLEQLGQLDPEQFVEVRVLTLPGQRMPWYMKPLSPP